MEVNITTKPLTKQTSEATTPSRLEADLLPRRDFLGLAAAWSAAMAFSLATFGIIKLPKTSVYPSPSKKFRIAIPESLGDNEPYVPAGRNVALYRNKEGIHAISIICTHLGCIVKPTPVGFDCPCHGSRFSADGSVTRGPAPKALAWLKVSKGKGGTFIVDEGEEVPSGTKVVV